jgi:hypothetical protein
MTRVLLDTNGYSAVARKGRQHRRRRAEGAVRMTIPRQAVAIRSSRVSGRGQRLEFVAIDLA